MNRRVRDLFVRFTVKLIGIIVIAFIVFMFAFIFGNYLNLSNETIESSVVRNWNNASITPAVLGSLALAAFTGFFGGTVGVFVAIYIVFYGDGKVLHKILISVLSLLSGFPSVIYGLVGYTFLIYMLSIPKSLLSAGITVSCMIIPFIALRVRKVLEEKSKSFYNLSLTHGLTRNYIIKNLVMPLCLSEILDSILLGMFYGIGAVAPILYTGVVMQASAPKSLLQPFMSLPYHLYMIVTSGYSDFKAYACAVALIIMLLTIQLFSKAFSMLRVGAEFKRHRGHKK